MARIILATDGQKLIKVDCPKIASGDKNADYLQVNCCPSWDGFTKTAVFYRNENEVYYAKMSGDQCTIPWEVLQTEGFLYLGIFGSKNNVRKTSEIISYKIDKGAIVDDLKPSDPTPDIYDQIMSAVAPVSDYGLGELGKDNSKICCYTKEALDKKMFNGFWAYRSITDPPTPLIDDDGYTYYVKGITLAYSTGAVTQIGVCNSNGKVIIREYFETKWNSWRYLAETDNVVPISRKINNIPLTADISLTADNVGAAPAGFGLGLTGIIVGGTSGIKCITPEELNAKTVNGFWVYQSDTTPLIPTDAKKMTQYVKGITIAYDSGTTVQIGFCNYSGKQARWIVRERFTDWGEWEWVNPPMLTGLEYRTTERCGDSPVYVKRIGYTPGVEKGSTTSTVSVYVPHGVTNFGRCVRCIGMRSTLMLPMIDATTGGSSTIRNFNNEYIVLQIDKMVVPANATFTFDFYYTKTA